MRPGWQWTLFVAFELTHSLYQLWKTAWERGTSDDELLVAFEGKQTPWSTRLLGIRLLVGVGFFASLQLRFGRGIDALLLCSAVLVNAINLLITVPPTVGIHKKGLFINNGWLKWDAVRRYRWTNPGTLEVNPGFFSLSFMKLEIPEEFVADVKAMLDSQCPDCEIRAS